jgi:hypothetical protein
MMAMLGEPDALEERDEALFFDEQHGARKAGEQVVAEALDLRRRQMRELSPHFSH